MIFEQISAGGCQSYLVGCAKSCAAAVIDPHLSRIGHYGALAARHSLRIRYLIDTHTHADHFSGARAMAERLNAHVVTHRLSPAPYADLHLDDGEALHVGDLRLEALYTPGHTRDSLSLLSEGRLFTGDTLLIGGTGRTDLPTGDPDALYDSLFHRLLKLDPALMIFPAHDYKGQSHSTLGEEIATNPRLQKRDRADFVAMMRALNMEAPAHLTEALRVNCHGGKSLEQLLNEASAEIGFMSPDDVARKKDGLVLLDVREHESFASGHIPGARNLPRGQLEMAADRMLPDADAPILACCEDGVLSTLAAATLRQLGFTHAMALEGGVKAWREKGLPLSKI